MKRDIDDLKDLPFACIFIDECHSAKSPQSKMFETLHSFACTVRFGMTVRPPPAFSSSAMLRSDGSLSL